MIEERQVKLAERFSELHRADGMFILPNVWDPGSARVFEKEGFNAVGTTSAGMAYSMGYPDGESLSMDDLVLSVGAIARRVDIPLSVDFERGYGRTAEEVKENARRLVNAGAVGFNIEDGMADGNLEDLALQLEKIRALADLKSEMNLPFVINARTCAYWLNVGDSDTKEQIAIERCNAFILAGADCAFVPGALDEATVTKLVRAIDGPVNIILNPLFHDFKKLEEIGVKRLSIGSGAVRSLLGHLIEIARDLKADSVREILSSSFSYADANKYFTP